MTQHFTYQMWSHIKLLFNVGFEWMSLYISTASDMALSQDCDGRQATVWEGKIFSTVIYKQTQSKKFVGEYYCRNVSSRIDSPI